MTEKGILPEDIRRSRSVTEEDCHHFVHKTHCCTVEVHYLQPLGVTLNCVSQTTRISPPPQLHSKLFEAILFLPNVNICHSLLMPTFFPQLEKKQIKLERIHFLKKRKSYVTRFFTQTQYI